MRRLPPTPCPCGVGRSHGPAAGAERRPPGGEPRPRPREPPRPAAPPVGRARLGLYRDFGPPGAVASRTHVDDLDFTEVAFANGVRLNLKKTTFEQEPDPRSRPAWEPAS